MPVPQPGQGTMTRLSPSTHTRWPMHDPGWLITLTSHTPGRVARAHPVLPCIYFLCSETCDCIYVVFSFWRNYGWRTVMRHLQSFVLQAHRCGSHPAKGSHQHQRCSTQISLNQRCSAIQWGDAMTQFSFLRSKISIWKAVLKREPKAGGSALGLYRRQWTLRFYPFLGVLKLFGRTKYFTVFLHSRPSQCFSRKAATTLGKEKQLAKLYITEIKGTNSPCEASLCCLVLHISPAFILTKTSLKLDCSFT